MSARTLRFAFLSCFLTLSTGAAVAQVAPDDSTNPLAALAMSDPRLRAEPATEPLAGDLHTLAGPVSAGWTSFRALAPGWRAFVDRRTGLIEVTEGGGVAWIAGRGNRLAAGVQPPDLAELEKIARTFLPRVAPFFGVDPAQLKLNRGRSGQLADQLWTVDFDVERGGLTVEGARLVFRVSHGNLVQMGTENLPSPDATVPVARLARAEALAVMARTVGGFSAADRFIDGGSLHLLPLQKPDVGFAGGFRPGSGRGLALAWEATFQRRGVTGTWRVRVDAETGDLLELADMNRYGQVQGGVYLDSPSGGETLQPMPFADLSSGGFTLSSGIFLGTGAVSTTLAGPYVKIEDSCGPISAATDWKGDISLGTSGGTDCATPGSGGAGNTHSARTQFHSLNRAKEIGRTWLPGNAWLSAQLRAETNVDATCNAFWDGSAVHFYRSGGGCGNTGEISAISLHEYGHGLDHNDGNGPSTDLATAETYGDWTAALITHDSCMGSGYETSNCGGYGDPCTSCSGVRDIDWAQRVSNTPHTVANLTQLSCPYSPAYIGPCGREGHCESAVSSEALWDFVNRDLPDPGSHAAWSLTERLWYVSRPTATAAFSCRTSVSPWSSDGCGIGSLWRTLRAADDDDGDLTNGTPNSCYLRAAFERHGITCPADIASGAAACHRTCTPPTTPAVSLAVNQIVSSQLDLSWASSGPGVVYDVFRSEIGCSSGFLRVQNDGTASSFSDNSGAPGTTYFYRVTAHAPGNESCSATPSACAMGTPQAPTCTPPAAPGALTVTVQGSTRADLAWQAVPGAAGYNVYRSAQAGGPYELAATVTATAWSDLTLAGGSVRYYVVRSFAGRCESAASAERRALTEACVTHRILRQDFETGAGTAGGWTTGVLQGSGTNSWQGVQDSCTAHGGNGAFRFGGATCLGQYAADQLSFAHPPEIQVPAGAIDTRLTFWQSRDFEAGYDGGKVGLDVDDGGTFHFANDAEIVSGARENGTVADSCAPGGLSGISTFTGQSAGFESTVFDLDPVCDRATQGTGGCAGHALKVGFLGIADCVVNRTGWLLDDVEVTSCVRQQESPSDFYTVTPCRLVDTRLADGPNGGPILQPGEIRTFVLTGRCGIPAEARALALNLGIFAPPTAGDLQMFPADLPEVVPNAVSFQQAQVRANFNIVTLSRDGSGTVKVRVVAPQAAHLFVDVTGYFLDSE